MTGGATGLMMNDRSEEASSCKGVTATGRDVELGGVDIGTVVKVKGGVGVFREMRQMLLERISIIRTTNDEAAAWAENNAFQKDVLGKPWVVSADDERRAKRKAEGLDRARKERRRRKQMDDISGRGGVEPEKEKEKRRRMVKRTRDQRREDAIRVGPSLGK